MAMWPMEKLEQERSPHIGDYQQFLPHILQEMQEKKSKEKNNLYNLKDIELSNHWIAKGT